MFDNSYNNYNSTPITGTSSIDLASCLGWILGIAVLIFFFMLPSWTCTEKTKNIGYPHRWGLLSGCQIEVSEDQWIPLESFYFRDGGS